MANFTPLYQTQTALALDNFTIGQRPMPASFIQALGYVKAACACTNAESGEIDEDIGEAIWQAAREIGNGHYADQFPVDIYQTGSGTSTNMNANEVIATLASRACGKAVHPNDHVNRGQSSNDVIPTTMHVAIRLQSEKTLLPAITALITALEKLQEKWGHIVKTGRTHLMDAMPISLGQEFGGWIAQLTQCRHRFDDTHVRLCQLAIGGTAVGTGINTSAGFGSYVASSLTRQLDIPFTTVDSHVAAQSSQDTCVEYSGQLNTLAVALMKISNDLRWMNSGPLAGLGEISLPKLQAGSSIMPGKVNPVIPEATAMACAQVMGLHSAVSIAGQSGNFQLNVMLPLIAVNILDSIALMSRSCHSLAEQALNDIRVNEDKISHHLAMNPILITALNESIGYELGAKIAQQAYQQQRPIIDVAAELTDFSKAELEQRLDPRHLI
jgi:fumarate hydratase class II